MNVKRSTDNIRQRTTVNVKCRTMVNGQRSTKNVGERSTDNGERPLIPYGRQLIDDDDIAAVVETLRSDWLTTGPKVAEFEEKFAAFAGAKAAVAVNSGTAALHAAMYAIEIGPGDEVILPPMTFAATANCVVYQGGTPVVVDVEPHTLLIDPDKIEEKITPHTKAIIAVDYAGHPGDYDALRDIARCYGLFLVADACHALGAEYKGRKVGTLADLTVFSFHPVKHITTGEGGMITTDDPEVAERMRKFRNHGITRKAEEFTVHGSPSESRTTDNGQRLTDNGKRTTVNGQRAVPSWYYEMQDLGYNYRITDFQCALGVSQLNKLPKWLARRQEIARIYDAAFAGFPYVMPLSVCNDVLHAYHLYVVRIMDKEPSKKRESVFNHLREKGIEANVHYLPVHLHPFYKKRFHTDAGLCPVAEQAYEDILSLPMFPKLKSHEQEYVIKTIKDIWS